MELLTTYPSRIATRLTHVIYDMPILILMPHSSCNCRCVMCDIWKANSNKKELSIDDLQPHIQAFKKLNVKWVVLSGGEALLHSNLWQLCKLLSVNNIKISLLSTGLLLKKYAKEIVENFIDVIVSLDGNEETHNLVRNLPNAYQKLKEGISEIRRHDPSFKITGRSVIQRFNFKIFPEIISSAKEIGLNQISFLAADVSSNAFNREELWGDERISEVALSPDETIHFEEILEMVIVENEVDFNNRFIAETPDKLRKIVQYYKALNGKGYLPEVICNAPWVSTVIESDGTVLPCYFHKPLGNIHQQTISEIINSTEAIKFRKNLNVATDSICQKCVCSLKLGITASF